MNKAPEAGPFLWGSVWTPTHFYLFDGTSLTQTVDAADAANVASNYVYMLMLSTGQALVGPGLQLYSDGGAPDSASAPQITSVPNNLTAGDTYTVSGKQLNGLSDGAAFGDDWQMSTDYPLVQITHDATSTVTYARTFGMTNRSIAHGAASSSQFALPTCIPEGPSHLRVVADGIASAAVAVTVGEVGCAKALTVTSSGNGDGTVTSSPEGIDCGSVCSHPFADGTEVTLTASPATGHAQARLRRAEGDRQAARRRQKRDHPCSLQGRQDREGVLGEGESRAGDLPEAASEDDAQGRLRREADSEQGEAPNALAVR
jgi:hypothetical protein